MSTTPKSPKGLKGLECKKRQLSSWPHIPYVLPANLVNTKKVPESLKIKRPDGTVFNMSIFSQENTKEYLVHIVAGHLSSTRRLIVVLPLVAPPLPCFTSHCIATSYRRTGWLLYYLLSRRLCLASALLTPPPPAMLQMDVVLNLIILPYCLREQGKINNGKAPLSAPPCSCHHMSRGKSTMPRCHCHYPLACPHC
jgi:hypothetical protein